MNSNSFTLVNSIKLPKSMCIHTCIQTHTYKCASVFNMSVKIEIRIHFKATTEKNTLHKYYPQLSHQIFNTFSLTTISSNILSINDRAEFQFETLIWHKSSTRARYFFGNSWHRGEQATICQWFLLLFQLENFVFKPYSEMYSFSNQSDDSRTVQRLKLRLRKRSGIESAHCESF